MSQVLHLSSEDFEAASVGLWMKANRITEIQTFHWDVAIWEEDRLMTDHIQFLSVSENHGMLVRCTLTLFLRV